ncbi:MAG: MoxR family ATPase [Armatimonadetes bacterium]|nr:MoxR family ATPase [Armatimonadota bacterium]
MSTELQSAENLAAQVREQLARVIVGQDDVIEQLLVAVLARGHVLVEGVPGTAKTLMVKALALCLGRDFKRVQMTPDLMPSDILGTSVFDLQTSSFNLRRGPIFTTFLLADEINRAPAKTQSALLEGMQERQVTIDGVSHPLDADFTVFATQNPIEYEGTYPLPEAQLDRFLLKVLVEYPEQAEEVDILRRRHAGFRDDDLAAAGILQVPLAEQLPACRQAVLKITVTDEMLQYIAAITRLTRDNPHLVLGCSPRASAMLLEAGKVLAALRGRDFLTPDDVKDIAPATLRHRLILRPEADIEGLSADDVIASVLAAVPVPR